MYVFFKVLITVMMCIVMTWLFVAGFQIPAIVVQCF